MLIDSRFNTTCSKTVIFAKKDDGTGDVFLGESSHLGHRDAMREVLQTRAAVARIRSLAAQERQS